MRLDKSTTETGGRCGCLLWAIDIVYRSFGVMTHVELSYKYPGPSSAPSVEDPFWFLEDIRPLRTPLRIKLNFGETDFCDKDRYPIIWDCPGLRYWRAKAY